MEINIRNKRMVRSQGRANMIQILDAIGIETIINHIIPVMGIEDIGFTMDCIAILDQERWVRTLPVAMESRNYDPNQLRIFLKEEMVVLEIDRQVMRMDGFLPRSEFQGRAAIGHHPLSLEQLAEMVETKSDKSVGLWSKIVQKCIKLLHMKR